MRQITILCSALCFSALLVACAVVGMKLETPKLSVLSVELLKADLFAQKLKARMKVQNPNNIELPVRGISYSIELGGAALGSGLSGKSFIVPARGEAEFSMEVDVNLAGTLLKLAEQARKTGTGTPQTLEYRLRGEVKLDALLNRSVPFEAKGSLRLR
ncbi:MAG: hypothetical protein EXR88_02385 [Gammaproteobacteria bacterium]|nr:hypothetical protein [Gammaproteobacteria bacterium]